MQLIKISLIIFLVIFSWDSCLFAQIVTTKEYEVLNNLYRHNDDSKRFRVYKNLAPNSVFKGFINMKQDSVFSFLGTLDEEKFREIMKNFELDKEILNTLDQDSIELNSSKLDCGIRIKKSKNKSNLLSRPLISGNYAILYLKSPCDSYVEKYVFAKKVMDNWVYYGDFMISSRYVETPVYPKIKRIWKAIFRNRYCD
jgi:hypothetical protein